MSRLRAILDRINDVEAAIVSITNQASPDSALAYRLTLQSLENRRDTFREELAEITKQEFIEVCDYRIVPQGSVSYSLSAVTSVLHEFQQILSIVFDAIVSKPKQKFVLSADIQERTRLNFGFAYAGSLGIALTIPNERLIAIDSDLDNAIKGVFSLLDLNSPENIKLAESSYGIPAIRKLYTWSKTHRDYGMTADIKWIRDNKVRSSVITQPANFARICEMIESKSDDKTDPITVTGVLEAWSVIRRTFSLRVTDAEIISGSIAKSFDTSKPRTVHGIPCRFSLIKHTTIVYTSEKDLVYWELIDIEE